MKRIAKGSCHHSLPPEVTRVEGCCIARDRLGLTALLGEYYEYEYEYEYSEYEVSLFLKGG